jgi:Tol biopolymer transport system component
VPTGDLNAYAPTWSPDGSLIAFVGTKGDQVEIWTVRSDGRGRPRQITHGATALRARWEVPTGQLLVSGTWGGGQYELRRVWLDGGKTEPLEPPVRLGEFGALFDVSRDGGLIAYCREKKPDGNVWVLEAEKESF